MPTNQPNNAPAETPAEAGDDATAAAVLNDEQGSTTPGGGGLRGPGASDSASTEGGQTPNSPIDVPTGSVEAAEAQVGHEASLRAAGTDGLEDHPSSQ
jgi:hypothetical protein